MWGYICTGEVQCSWCAELSQAVICLCSGEVPAVLSMSVVGNPGLSCDCVIATSLGTSLVESAGATGATAEVRQSSDVSRKRIHRFFLLQHITHVIVNVITDRHPA